MTTDDLLRVVEALVGLAIAGEALALLVGMHLLSPRPNPWITTMNDLLLAVDGIAGIALIGLAVGGGNRGYIGMLYLCLAVAVLGHAYREWQWIVKAPDRFCVNRPLLAVNTLKLAALVVLAGLAAL